MAEGPIYRVVVTQPIEITEPIGTKSVDPERVDKAATEWGKTIAAVLTAGGVITLLQGDQKLAALGGRSDDLAVGLLLAALGSAVAAIVIAFSIPWEKAETPKRTLVHWLYGSIGTTILALGFLTGFALVVFAGDKQPQQYLVTFATDKSVVCGTIEGADAAPTVAAKPLVDIASIVPVGRCPSG